METLENETVAELEAKHEGLKARIADLLGQTLDGSDHSEEIAGLAKQAARCATELQEAREQADETETTRLRADAKCRRDRLELLLVEAADAKSDFTRLYKEACLALGAYCSCIDKATRLAGTLAVGPLGVAPQDTWRIGELKKGLDPLSTLLMTGLQKTAQYGWNIGLQVIPLHELGKE